jgi:pyridoxal 5'-phosphate synthase pdxS subunit
MTGKHPIPKIPGFTAEELVSKIGFCEQLKGGVIMDVIDPEQARIAEEAGACAVMALERVPADIRKHGGVARASDPDMIVGIQKAVSIPVMAKVRIGHFVEAQMLESMEVDCIDESEVLTPADEEFQIDKRVFKTPFVCGCRDLGEALRRIHEGAAMIRTKGEAGTGNVVEAVRHMRTLMTGIRALRGMDSQHIERKAVEMRVPYELVAWVAEHGKLPVPNFSAGGVATPADAALMMQLGAEAVFVGSGIFKSGDPVKRARAIVRAVTHFEDPKVLVEVSKGLGEPMVGIDINTMPAHERLAGRGI